MYERCDMGVPKVSTLLYVAFRGSSIGTRVAVNMIWTCITSQTRFYSRDLSLRLLLEGLRFRPRVTH